MLHSRRQNGVPEPLLQICSRHVFPSSHSLVTEACCLTSAFADRCCSCLRLLQKAATYPDAFSSEAQSQKPRHDQENALTMCRCSACICRIQGQALGHGPAVGTSSHLQLLQGQ